MFPIGEPARSCKVILVLTVVLIPADASSNPVVSRFDNLLKALDKAILYSIRNYKYMNFDGVFGLWIAEGYLKHILSAPNIWEENPVVEKLGKIKEDLSEKYSSLRKVLPDVVESLKQHDIGYFQRMGSLLEMDWSPHPATPLLDVGTLMNLPKNQTTFDEELSDRCISQLLVTNYTASRCRPSIDCLELITGSPSHGYELTHQILYIAVVMQLGCTAPFTAILEPRGIDLLIRSENLCSHTYLELISLMRLESLTARHRDLLMEQIFVCAHMGFVQFDQLPLLDMIISWQHPSGCFTDGGRTSQHVQNGVAKRRLSEEHRLPGELLTS
ncbi:hypothetical protein FBUS_05264 [Fasciolopsis buskii]|uniref:Uncharacterized protein n=1 Tax=Fasciolopsis buskii TaxID=27845 RepID=A0A8E0RX24_9TREM|nr:hypothetical protein FBUS_05264 [Fasciolopsis buski]